MMFSLSRQMKWPTTCRLVPQSCWSYGLQANCEKTTLKPEYRSFEQNKAKIANHVFTGDDGAMANLLSQKNVDYPGTTAN